MPHIMSRWAIWSRRLAFVGLLLLALPRDARAYVDPGTGSLAWQLVLSTLFGAAFYARRAVGLVRRSLQRRLRGDAADPAGASGDTTTPH